MKKKILAALAVLALSSAPVMAQNISALTDGLKAFTDKTPASLPFAAGAGLDWSDAYIGPLIGGDFPFLHLGVGGNIGMTSIPSAAVKPLLSAVGQTLPDGLDFIPLPYAVANARIGGLILPFDVGLKYGFVPAAFETVGNFTFKYSNFGMDVRYQLLQGNILLPDISVGGGFDVLAAGISVTQGQQQVFSNGSGDTLTLGAPKLSMDLTAFDINAKVQVSKTLLWILTPYAGLGASFGSATAKSSIGANVTYSAGTDAAWWKNNYNVDVSGAGVKSEGSATPFGLKAYGGVSLNILILKADVQAMYNLLDGAIGASVGLRAQL